MEWTSFLIGLVLGLALMWLLGWIMWRDRRDYDQTERGLQAQIGRLKSTQTILKTDLVFARNELAARAEQISSLVEQIARLEEPPQQVDEGIDAPPPGPPAAAPRGAVEQKSAEWGTIPPPVKSGAAGREADDDLTLLFGIGPQISRLLRSAGLGSFRRLAESNEGDIREILAAAGPRFKLAGERPESWRAQAALAAEGRWEDLEALQSTLRGAKD